MIAFDVDEYLLIKKQKKFPAVTLLRGNDLKQLKFRDIRVIIRQINDLSFRGQPGPGVFCLIRSVIHTIISSLFGA